MKLFLSYHHIDKEFAKYFTDWLYNCFDNIEIFSTSHPTSIIPGQSWFDEIVRTATSVDMIFLLIGPDSINYRWMLFEAGLTAVNRFHKVVPIVFGGVTVDDIKMPLSFYQILKLDDRQQFNAFFAEKEFVAKKTVGDFYVAFLEADPLKELYIRYGSFSKVYTDQITHLSAIETMKDEYELTNIGQATLDVNRHKSDKHEIYLYPVEKPSDGTHKSLVSVRLTLRPIRCEGESTWKAGIAFDRERVFGGIDHVFAVQSGNHRGLSSWSLYWKGGAANYSPINIPAILDFEVTHSINIWLNREKNELLAYGIDSDRNRCLFTINGRERIWNPNLLEATSLQIHSWIDDTMVHQFRLKMICELDYC